MKKKTMNDANPVRVIDNSNDNDDDKEYDKNLLDYKVTQTTRKTHFGRITKIISSPKETSYSIVTVQVITKTMHYLNNLVLSMKKMDHTHLW
jgi:predicted nucleic acid-binding protein